jgi:hypothetical protein
MVPRAIQSGVSAWDISNTLFSDASNIAGLGELSIAFLFDDNLGVALGDAALDCGSDTGLCREGQHTVREHAVRAQDHRVRLELLACPDELLS